MPSTYTTSLKLTLPATGENSGTWGALVNDGITTLIDKSIAGTSAVAMTDADYTLTTGDGSAANESRSMFITMTGTLTAARNVICPAVSKMYVFTNNTTGGYAVTLKTSAGAGISVPNGKRAVLYCNATDVLDGITHANSLTLGTALPVTSGGTGVTTSTGSGANVLATSPTLVTPLLGTPTSGVMTNVTGLPLTTGVTGTLPVANGGTGAVTLTGLVKGSGTSAFTAATAGTDYVAPGGALGTPSSGTLTNATGLPLTTGVTGTLPVANGGTGVTTSTGSGNNVLSTSPTINTGTFSAGTFTDGYTEETVTANTSTAYTIDLANGTVQILTLTGNCTFTYPTATAGKSFILLLKQDGTGGRTVTWPATVKWPGATAPTITSTASKLDKYVFTADGTNWYGSNGGQNYTV